MSMPPFDNSPTPFRPIQREDIEMLGEWGGRVNYKSKKVAFFHHNPVHNAAKSAEQGTPVYDDKIFIKILEPGNSLEIIDRECNEADKHQWAQQWNQFCRNAEQQPDGTPLDVLFPTNPSVPATLRSRSIFTIEQLAELSAHSIQQIMGGQDYANKAKTYLEQAQKGVALHRFEKEMATKDSEIRTLKQQLDRAIAAINELQATIETGQHARLQNMVAGQQLRPTFPMPQPPSAPSFDAQSAQIASVRAENMPKPRRSRLPVQ